MATMLAPTAVPVAVRRALRENPLSDVGRAQDEGTKLTALARPPLAAPGGPLPLPWGWHQGHCPGQVSPQRVVERGTTDFRSGRPSRAGARRLGRQPVLSRRSLKLPQAGCGSLFGRRPRCGPEGASKERSLSCFPGRLGALPSDAAARQSELRAMPGTKTAAIFDETTPERCIHVGIGSRPKNGGLRVPARLAVSPAERRHQAHQR